MILLFDLSLVAFALLTIIPAAVLLAQVIFSVAEHTPVHGTPQQDRPRVAVLIPAHNEEDVIAQTLSTVKLQLGANDRLVVVADNCSDNTAAIARELNVEVIERHNPDRRGKSYALDFGINSLRGKMSPQVVVVVDADCRPADGCIQIISQLCSETGRPIQAVYLMEHPHGEMGIFSGLTTFAWKIKNFVRPVGWHRLGFPCQLTGSGMALPWSVIDDVELASGDLAEDLRLGVELSLRGHPPLFCPDALVTSRFPDDADAGRSQRTRWEHGYLASMVRFIPALLSEIVRQKSVPLLGILLNLCVPPLALLLLAIIGGDTLCYLFFVATLHIAPLAIISTSLVMTTASVLLAWSYHGRDIVSLSQLALAPAYALSKIPLYVAFLINREREWVKTKRSGPLSK
jgi:cellulose synthase/poly-beta-1,6-N-acetylglucosamine synthase-like glycosyltransferase